MDANDVRRRWADRSGEFSPEYYVYYGPNKTSEATRRVFDERLDASASILELGCGLGRHLSHLHEHGSENLHGVDINPNCLEAMANAYPDLARCGTLHVDAIEEIVEEFSLGQFDTVYSVEMLQHIHPDDAWVFEAVARSANDYVVTVENEGDRLAPPEDRGINDEEYDFPLYYRDWAAVLDPFGFEQVACEHGDRNTHHMFRRVD